MTSIRGGNAASVNAAVFTGTNIPSGTILSGKYEVISKMDITTGEADLYVCHYKNKDFAAKVYRRELAIKSDVVTALKGIHSQYIARLHDAGTYNGFPFDILPYYKLGSLQGRQDSFDELFIRYHHL